MMTTLSKTLTALAALAFVLAMLANFTGPIIGTFAEGFSRASNNLALLAIAVRLVFGPALIAERSTIGT